MKRGDTTVTISVSLGFRDAITRASGFGLGSRLTKLFGELWCRSHANFDCGDLSQLFEETSACCATLVTFMYSVE